MKNEDHRCFTPQLLGQDPLDVERIWHDLWVPKLVGRRGLTTRAISAIDVALWDLRAKAAGMPLYKLRLGIDDWALRRGRTYGTILVDLERHRPNDLLADRSAATLEQWLREHPGVEIISRDRANDYADGASCGAPNAIQVADRFHLLKNSREMLERLLERNHAILCSAAQEVSHRMAAATPLSVSTNESIIGAQGSQNVASCSAEQAQPLLQNEQRRQQHRAKRLARYTEVRRLQAEGMGIRAVARQLKMSREAGRRFFGDQFPERARRAPGRSKLAPYIPCLTVNNSFHEP